MMECAFLLLSFTMYLCHGTSNRECWYGLDFCTLNRYLPLIHEKFQLRSCNWTRESCIYVLESLNLMKQSSFVQKVSLYHLSNCFLMNGEWFRKTWHWRLIVQAQKIGLVFNAISCPLLDDALFAGKGFTFLETIIKECMQVFYGTSESSAPAHRNGITNKSTREWEMQRLNYVNNNLTKM